VTVIDLFVAAVTVLYVFTAYITLSPADFLVHKFKLDVPNSWLFRVALIEIAILGLVMSSLLEVILFTGSLVKFNHVLLFCLRSISLPLAML
jgi:hypothetical protein